MNPVVTRETTACLGYSRVLAQKNARLLQAWAQILPLCVAADVEDLNFSGSAILSLRILAIADDEMGDLSGRDVLMLSYRIGKILIARDKRNN
jgi:hypothetical protein